MIFVMSRFYNSNWGPSLFTIFVFASISPLCIAQQKGINYDEAKVPDYTLPRLFTKLDGEKVSGIRQWNRDRRTEILRLFEEHMYGRHPAKPERVEYIIHSLNENALAGEAVRKEVIIRLGEVGPRFDLHVLLYLPAGVNEKVPVFLGYNFGGNHTIHADPAIRLSQAWMRRGNDEAHVNHRATEAARGLASSRWPVQTILDRGYGLVTLYYGDVEPDRADGWKDGIRAHVKKDRSGDRLEPEDWGAIAVWAWGLSRVMDYLETDGAVRADRVAVMGHSRLGKTSLWAGASDRRFAIVISNNSGCGGAALSRRAFGETIQRINTRFPHWFCRNFKNYDSNESELPIDQHMLIASMAPRPVYVASAAEDLWADPMGEFLSAMHADPVYELFNKTGLGVEDQPGLNHPVGDFIGYHLRSGKHDVTDYDWEQYLNFADRHFNRN